MTETMTVFIKSYKGNSKKGTDICIATFAEVGDYTRVKDFFVDVKDDRLTDKIADLTFGDIVTLETTAVSAFSNSVEIIDVTTKAPSPYFEE